MNDYTIYIYLNQFFLNFGGNENETRYQNNRKTV